MKKIYLVPMMSALISLSAPSFAANGGNGPCRQDAEKLCSGLSWGKGLGKCLNEHKTQLSEACQAKIKNGHKEGKEFHQACAEDVREYCKGVKPGEGRIRECLKDNRAKLSTSCKNEFGDKS